MKREQPTKPDEPASRLRERVKELGCLYDVSQIMVDAGLTRDERLRRIVAVLPRAWRFPDTAVARITLDGERFESPSYEQVGAAQQADLVVEGVRRGSVEVGYLSTPPADPSAPFLPEEDQLLANVARQVSLFLTREEGAARRAMLEEQLRHADRLATIGQLAAGVAHEMNEPLSSVLGLAQLALKAPELPQTVIDDLRGIVAASLRAREIVKKLLLFARQTPPRKSRVTLNEIVEDALFLLEAGCEKQGIRLLRELAAGLPTVEADPLQIRQVIVNLTVNAMQAIDAEGTVSVETRSDGRHVVLSVADTGHGMSPETLSRIFNPFFTTKDVGVGTGLGLAVVHGIVTAHGGTIEVESVQGKGSRFIVRLPVETAAATT
ncbi:MAG: Adaptive-response sensory-kinase SasA [Phycisphaerae bacterium]|nr:Adaptive-response sensory-kinase SasA [Phycisphaerae bacterium]